MHLVAHSDLLLFRNDTLFAKVIVLVKTHEYSISCWIVLTDIYVLFILGYTYISSSALPNPLPPKHRGRPQAPSAAAVAHCDSGAPPGPARPRE